MTTAMVIELITRSPHTDPNVEFFAHTLAEYDAPNAVRRKVGFEFLGKRRHAEQREIWKGAVHKRLTFSWKPMQRPARSLDFSLTMKLHPAVAHTL